MKAAVAAAMVLLVGVGSAVATPATIDFPSCMNDDDCMTKDSVSAGTVLCKSLYKASSSQIDKSFGKCVQCLDDCDCGTNEWCAPYGQVTGPFWTDDQLTNISKTDLANMKTLVTSLSNGYKILGQCVEYGDYSDLEDDRIGADCNGRATQPTQDPLTSNANAYCGFVYAWQPKYFDCIGSKDNCKFEEYENNNYGDPGQCTAIVNGSTIPTCDGGVGWSGRCQERTCQVCSTGDSRCNGNKGTPQTCIGGKWRTALYQDFTIYTLNHNTIAQVATVICVFVSLMLCMGCHSKWADHKNGRASSVNHEGYTAYRA